MHPIFDNVRWRSALLGAFVLPALLLPSSAAAQWLYSTATTLDVAGVTVTPRDVVSDLSGSVSVETLAGLPENTGLRGIHQEGAVTLFTSRTAVELPGALFLERRDVASENGGVYGIELDGSAAGFPLETAIDAVSRDASGDLLLSVDGFVQIAGLNAARSDVLRWDGVAFSLFFDASSEGVPRELNFDGLHYDTVGDDLLLSFDAAGSIGGVLFGREDIVRFDPNSGTWSLEFDASSTEPGLATSDLVAVPEPRVLSSLIAGLGLLFGLSAARSRQSC